MAVYGVSDARRSTGIERETLSAHVQADEIAVYDVAAMGPPGPEGHVGMLQASALGRAY
jgi:hypothetical protein